MAQGLNIGELFEEVFIQITPRWIYSFDHVHFDDTPSLFPPLLGGNCLSDISVVFVIDQILDAVPGSETSNKALAVGSNSLNQVTGHTYIQRSVPLTCHDVHKRWFHVIHTWFPACVLS